MRRVVPVALILSLAFALRAWGANFGLPYLYQPDESIVVRTALQVGDGSLRPYSFVYPALYSYLLFPFYGVYYVLGFALGQFHTLDDFAITFIGDPTWFYLIARLIVAIFGTATVGVIYLIGRWNYDHLTGLLAALFLAVTPLHVVHSHYSVTDIPMTFTVALAMLGISRFHNTARTRDFLLAAVTCGVAGAMKYTGILVTLPLVLSAGIVTLSKRWPLGQLLKSEMVGAVAVVVAFSVAAPYTLIDFGAFYRELFVFQQGMNREAGQSFLDILSFYLQVVIGNDVISDSLGVISLAGFVFLLIRHKAVDLLLLSLPAFFLVAMATQGRHQPNWMLPTVPFFSLYAAVLISTLLGKISPIGWGMKLAASIVILALVYAPVRNSIFLDYEMSQKDTRTIAKEWIENNIDADSKVLIDSPGAGPQLRANRASLEKYFNDKAEDKLLSQAPAEVRQTFAKYERYSLEALNRYGGKTYYVDYVFHEWWKPQENAEDLAVYPVFGNFKRKLFSIEELRELGFDYVVVTGESRAYYMSEEGRQKWPTYYQFYKSLDQGIEQLQEFRPIPLHAPGPTIRIYMISK